MKNSFKALGIFLILLGLVSCTQASKTTSFTGEELKAELGDILDSEQLADVDILIDKIENHDEYNDNVKDFISFIDCPYEGMSGGYGYVLKYSDGIEISVIADSVAESETIDEVCVTVNNCNIVYYIEKDIWILHQY